MGVDNQFVLFLFCFFFIALFSELTAARLLAESWAEGWCFAPEPRSERSEMHGQMHRDVVRVGNLGNHLVKNEVASFVSFQLIQCLQHVISWLTVSTYWKRVRGKIERWSAGGSELLDNSYGLRSVH